MPEALILPPTSPDLLGIAVVTQQREESVRDLGVLASSIVNDPDAKCLDFDGHASHKSLERHRIERTVMSADDKAVQLRVKISKAEVALEELIEIRMFDYIIVNEAMKEAAKQKAMQEFKDAIKTDPTLVRVEFASIELEVVMADGGMHCCIAKGELGCINFNDEFFQYFLGYFRRHIKARNYHSLDG